MADMMQFPNTVEEFMEKYKIVDTEQIYTNGAELVPIFRMEQWFGHIEGISSAKQHGQWKQVGDNTYKCSVCGEISCCNSPFCSECGAKMDGEQNE